MLSNILTGYTLDLMFLYILSRWSRFPTAHRRIDTFSILKSFRYAEKSAESVAGVGVSNFQKKAKLPS